MFDELNQEISKSGGTYVKLNRKEHGVLEGVILDAEVRDKTYEGQVIVSRKSGKPRKEWLFTLDTGGEEPVKFAANEGAQFAIRQAVKDAGGKLEKGGILKVGVKTDPASTTEQAEYQAKYTAPTSTPVTAAIEAEGSDLPPF